MKRFRRFCYLIRRLFTGRPAAVILIMPDDVLIREF